MNIVEQIIANIHAIQSNNPLLIGIDGMCAAGKTTLGGVLAERLNANLFHMDDFFLLPDECTPERLAEIGGNVAYERFNDTVLTPLLRGDTFTYPIYNCKTGETTQSPLVAPRPVNIVEGAYCLHPYFGEVYDYKLLLTIDEATQRERILKRNGEMMFERFCTVWIPMENRYIEANRLRECAEVIQIN